MYLERNQALPNIHYFLRSAKMRKFFVCFCCVAAMLFLLSCTHVAKGPSNQSVSPVLDRIVSKGEIVVGTAASMPPMNMTTKDGNVVGIEPDLAMLISKAMGVRLKIEAMKFNELLPALQSDKIDMILSNMTITAKRNMQVAFVGPYFTSGKSILAKFKTISEMGETVNINQENTRLAALKGSTSQDFVENQIPKATLITIKDYDEGIQMVLDGTVHAMVADYPICLVSVFRYPDKELTALTKLLSYEPIGVAVPAGDPLLINWLENFLSTASASGVMDRLKAKWLEDDSWLTLLP
jgi:polar amino acid transport system substrate-binding protein